MCSLESDFDTTAVFDAMKIRTPGVFLLIDTKLTASVNVQVRIYQTDSTASPSLYLHAGLGASIGQSEE